MSPYFNPPQELPRIPPPLESAEKKAIYSTPPLKQSHNVRFKQKILIFARLVICIKYDVIYHEFYMLYVIIKTGLNENIFYSVAHSFYIQINFMNICKYFRSVRLAGKVLKIL